MSASHIFGDSPRETPKSRLNLYPTRIRLPGPYGKLEDIVECGSQNVPLRMNSDHIVCERSLCIQKFFPKAIPSVNEKTPAQSIQ